MNLNIGWGLRFDPLSHKKQARSDRDSLDDIHLLTSMSLI